MVILIVAVAAIGGGLYAVGTAISPVAVDDPSAAKTVRIEAPERGDLAETISAPGEVEPRRKVSISARIAARIMAMPVDEGDPVTATISDPQRNSLSQSIAATSGGGGEGGNGSSGTLLLRLDASDLEAALRAAEAQRAVQMAQIDVARAKLEGQRAAIAGTEASLREAGIDFERQKQLLTSKDVSQSVVDLARRRVDEITAQLEAARHALVAEELNIRAMELGVKVADAGIAKAREDLQHTVISSPINGTVTRINAEVGELVMTGTMNNAGTVIMEIADLSQMLFVAQVDEADIGDLKVGQSAEIQLQAYPTQTFTGKVESIALRHDAAPNGGKYFKTEIAMDMGERQIYSGLTGDAQITTRRSENVVIVPSQAVLGRPIDGIPLTIREGNEYIDKTKTFAAVVYRFIDGKAVVTPVTIGPSDTTRTVILGGLTEEDRVITGPYKELEAMAHDQKVIDEMAAATTAAAGTSSDDAAKAEKTEPAAP